MTTLQVPDMHCENCVRRITEALTREGLTFQVNLDQKTVRVDGDAQAVAAAVEALDDLGFETKA